MKILELVQGSDEWLAARKEYFTASEAPAMMGESKYISRTQLLDHKKGWTTEVDEFTKKLFAKGHATEQSALPLVEKIIGEDLYPVVGVLEGAKYLASFDGLTMMEDVIFEHKLFAKQLAENVLNDVLEPHYYWQLEHQLLVSGADKVIFVVSDGTDSNWKHMFYESLPERRESLIAGWEQFEKDLVNHEPQAKTEKVIAEEVTALPAIRYEMNGLSLVSNLDEFKAQSDVLVELSQKPLETDQDFANAESRQKVFTKAEADIKSLADRVLGEVADIDKFTKDLRYIGEQIRQARLAEGKQIKSRKEEIKNSILRAAESEISVYRHKLNTEISAYMPEPSVSVLDAMKGKKTVDSLKDAADTAVAQIKIESSAYADVARTNIETLKRYATDYRGLFSDWKDIAFKDFQDFTALVKMRIADHKEQEQVRLNAERDRIRAEEQAKAQAEVEEKARQERLEQERIRAAGLARERNDAKEVERQEQQVEADQTGYTPQPEKQEYLKRPETITTANVESSDGYVLTLTDYQKGYIKGLQAYAWIKDGVYYVGNEGETLDSAKERFLKRENAA